ncbi:AAA family ATPase [Ramlibacter henchirensis]|nr:AAA family ATPase [Ramlibacter henchirensis]
MQEGDLALCVYDSRYRYVAQVLKKFENEDLARAIWGQDPEGRTWSLIYFLTEPQKLDVPLLDLAGYLQQGYMGFTRISDAKSARIKAEFGSINTFVEQQLLSRPIDAHPLDNITRQDVLDALARLDAGETHGYGPSTDYNLVHEGKPYPPKAAAGIATMRTLGRPLRPSEFSAGMGTKNFRVLEKLGFTIQPKPSDDLFFLIRSNEDSPYDDELGVRYHFTNTVPNHKKLLVGARVVVDSTSSNGTRLRGHGNLGPAQSKVTPSGSQEFVSEFTSWTPFSPPKPISAALKAQIAAQPGYNVQHAIRPLSRRLFEAITDGKPIDMIDEVVLIGTTRRTDKELDEFQDLVNREGGQAWWWSFPIKSEAQSALPRPFYVYLNRGGGVFTHRCRVDDFRTSQGNSGMESPWPEKTPLRLRGATRAGDRQSEVFKTWLLVGSVEEIKPALALSDFEPAAPWSSDNNILNQSTFGYAYRKQKTGVPTPSKPYTVDDAIEDIFLSKTDLEELIGLLSSKKNLILQGAPGTGKTYLAKRLAFALMGEAADDRVTMVQFHQSYSYEDFIGGYRPTGEGFAFKSGVFSRFCAAATQRPTAKFVFVIDEINRGNLSKILGEVMLLMESDKRGPGWAIPLTYSTEQEPPFYIPENVYIIGLMNTADRSLAMVDYALRRRFAFWTLLPAFESARFKVHLQSREIPEAFTKKIVDRMSKLNAAIAADKDLGAGFMVGHSFFTSPDESVSADAWYARVIRAEVAPLLAEYWFDKPASYIEDRVNELLA